MNILSSATVFSLFTLISRILGYVRDILIAVFLGASMLADAFFVAFRLPNTFRRLFAEGTFNAAFIPSYSSENSKSKSLGKKFADEVFLLLIISLLFITIIVEIFTPFLVYIIAPGFENDLEKFDLTVYLTRVTFPFLLFVTLSSFFSGILNTFNRFAAAAAAPIILNIVLIISLIISFITKLNYAVNLSYAVSLAGIIQFLFLAYFTKKYYKPSLIFKRKISEKVKLFLKKLVPSIFSSGVTQINILVGTIIASFQSSAVSYLYYADRIYQINLAIAGIAIGTVSLPALSSAIKQKKNKLINKIQNKSIELSLLLSLPASLGAILASEEIVSALFGYGNFNIFDVEQTAKALKFFGYGIIAFALIKILSNNFFARNDTKTPFYISCIIVLLNLSISIFYFRDVGFIILPIATSISSWIGTFLYAIILIKKNNLDFGKKFYFKLFKIILCSFAMSLGLLFCLSTFQNYLVFDYQYKSLFLILIVGFIAFIYLILCKFSGLIDLKSYKIKA